ncbi:mucin-4 [Maniola jurtina]|uniref:mucin-4 n=1 Tax=Maniola jurtina TaxID=191418 RepID=UPI001E68EBE4|nr:mucin-4 [Maniola jurtina]
MRWRREDLNINMASKTLIFFTILTLSSLQTCDGVRRGQRRRDIAPDLFIPVPSAESLTAIAQAMGAAGFEDYTEGKKTLVKRLIPHSQPDLDIVEHLGVIGKANVDFPALPNIPSTGFNCKNVPTGYYADLETDCQVFHICDTSRKISFLCPNGTIFSQSHLICDWWFKVDCASAPALYESSVEYYSNEQKKAQRISNFKNPEFQDSNVRAESKRTPVAVPSTTERLLRHRQKLQSEPIPPNAQATARSYQTLFDISTTQRTAAAFEKRRKNLVQLIANNFGNPPSRTTQPDYDSSTHKSTIPAYDHNSLKEMQEAAETASFAQNQNRQYLQEYNNKNFRPYPVYTPNVAANPPKAKSSPTLTTLYDIQAKHVPQYVEEATTKRQTLVPYTKSYATTINERREPYTRPGVSLLRDFLEKEKNKSISATTEKFAEVSARSDKFESKINSENKIAVETKDSFESVTKIPQTTRDEKITVYINDDVYTNSNPTTDTTEKSYQERRDRLQRKLSTDIKDTSEPTTETTRIEKYYGDQTNRLGLIVPPSISPKTLHSLAIYYATALDNLSTTPPPEDDETTTPALDAYEPIEQTLPDLFSRHTIAKYSNLFGRDADKAEQLEDIKLDPNSTYNELAEDLIVEMSQGPLASSPQIRELAQVFTHALSAYLQDPVQFRKVLSDIRPTHPSFGEMLTGNDEAPNTEPTTTVNEDDDEILGFSDDHKEKGHTFSDNSIRGGKALNIGTDYPTTVQDVTTSTTTTEVPSTSYYSTTRRNPFRCCGRISASYTTSPTTRNYYSTVNANTATAKLNFLATNQNTNTPTTDNYTPIRNERLQNTKFVTRFGKSSKVFDVTPSTDYTEVTTFPTAWGSEGFDSTLAPITNSHQMFESKKIRPTTGVVTETTPVYFTVTDNIDSVELENEEELQRAHSQSFVSPQDNSLRQGKQLKEDKKPVKKPAEDLEAPTQSDVDITTTTVQTSTTQPTTTVRDQTEALTTVTPISSSVFTSPDVEKSTNDFQWPTTFGNWHSTILDPITLNDGLSVTGPDQGVSEIAQQTNGWALDTATTPITYSTTTEPTVSSTTNIEITTTEKPNERSGKLLREQTSTEPAQDLSTVTDTIVEKAKEIMVGMNASTTQKLMNVMKKTKSKSVKRLILLLVQTCDDDHNSTAEASKKALLEALMAVSQKDMEEIAKEEESTEAPVTIPDTEFVRTTLMQRRSDRIPMQSRRGKSLNVDIEAINSLSNPTTTTVQPTATTESLKTETTEYTTFSTVRPTTVSRRGGRRFMPKTTEVELTSTTIANQPIAEARLPAQADLKPQSDTRALELLRSLYTIAARWG